MIDDLRFVICSRQDTHDLVPDRDSNREQPPLATRKGSGVGHGTHGGLLELFGLEKNMYPNAVKYLHSTPTMASFVVWTSPFNHFLQTFIADYFFPCEVFLKDIIPSSPYLRGEL